jgi:hypothetical protein
MDVREDKAGKDYKKVVAERRLLEGGRKWL